MKALGVSEVKKVTGGMKEQLPIVPVWPTGPGPFNPDPPPPPSELM